MSISGRRLLVGIAITAGLRAAGAQSTIAGVVRDSAGAPIAGATVAVPALNRSIQTDASGAFELTNVTPGMRMLAVRRIGFAAFNKPTSVGEGRNVMAPIVLARVVTKLDTVVSEEKLAWREDPSLREMADNMKIGLGKFVLRPELEKMTALHLSLAFQQRAGLQVVTDGGGHAWIASSRRRSISQECVVLENNGGGNSPRNAACSLCFPKVYLDNQPLSIRRNEVPEINQWRPENLEAIEMYSSAAQTPPRYAGLDSQCGVIILHSRKGPAKKGK